MKQENLNNLLMMLKEHEGFVDHLYRCPTGHLTIGYGHNTEAHFDTAKFENRLITRTEAESLLLNDLNNAMTDCMKSIRSFINLSEVQQCVLIDMCFSMGLGGLLLFKKMLAALASDDLPKAARSLFDSRLASQAPRRVMRLIFMLLTDCWL
jgi:lysozyme